MYNDTMTRWLRHCHRMMWPWLAAHPEKRKVDYPLYEFLLYYDIYMLLPDPKHFAAYVCFACREALRDCDEWDVMCDFCPADTKDKMRRCRQRLRDLEIQKHLYALNTIRSRAWPSC